MMKHINGKVLLALAFLGLWSSVQAEENSQEFFNEIAKVAAVCNVYTEYAIANTDKSDPYADEAFWWRTFLWNWIDEDEVVFNAMHQTVVDYIDAAIPDPADDNFFAAYKAQSDEAEAIAAECIDIRANLVAMLEAYESYD